MRRVGILVLTIVVLALPLEAGAHHKPKTYCSETGDLCQSVRKVDGVRSLRIALFAEYFEEFTICVRGPDDTATCKDFTIRDRGTTFGRSVRWSQHFPNEGPGAYVVTWRTAGERVGRRLGFHR